MPARKFLTSAPIVLLLGCLMSQPAAAARPMTLAELADILAQSGLPRAVAFGALQGSLTATHCGIAGQYSPFIKRAVQSIGDYKELRIVLSRRDAAGFYELEDGSFAEIPRALKLAGVLRFRRADVLKCLGFA